MPTSSRLPRWDNGKIRDRLRFNLIGGPNRISLLAMSRVARIVVPGFPHHEDEARVDQIRAHTRTGRPCGSPAFLDQLENLTHRAFRPKKRGRNAKASKLEKMIDREYLNVVYP